MLSAVSFEIFCVFVMFGCEIFMFLVSRIDDPSVIRDTLPSISECTESRVIAPINRGLANAMPFLMRVCGFGFQL